MYAGLTAGHHESDRSLWRGAPRSTGCGRRARHMRCLEVGLRLAGFPLPVQNNDPPFGCCDWHASIRPDFAWHASPIEEDVNEDFFELVRNVEP